MAEEKKPEGLEQQESIDKKSEQSREVELGLEKKQVFEKRESEGDIKKSREAQEKIKKSASTSSSKIDPEKELKDIKDLESIEEKIEKLLEVAVHHGPQKAIKLAQKLNSNYALDNMHDQMIDEEELNNKLQEKGFI